MQTLLVTGGAGFIGSEFVAQAVQAGRRVVVLDALTYAGHRANLEWIASPHASGGSWQLEEGNIADGARVSQLLAVHQPDALVNFAAESHVDNSISGPGAFIQTNINGVYQLLEAARAYWNGLDASRKSAFRFVQISTDEVYGSLGDTGAFTEDSPYRPNSPYSASKAGGDMLARAWFHTYGLPVITTHCTNNYGPRQFPEKLIPTMISCALEGKQLPVYGTGKNVRDWIHVADHCRGVALALEKGTPGECYGFGGRAERTNLQVVETLCNLLDRLQPRANGGSYREQIAFVTDRLGHDWRYAIDDSASEQRLGFSRAHDFNSGLEATVRWYLENRPWCEAVMAKEAA